MFWQRRAQRLMRRIKTDSLLARLLLAQGLMVAGAVLILGGMLTVERNALLAPGYAVLWEPTIRQVAAGPVGAPAIPAFDLPGGMRREPGPPSGWYLTPFFVTAETARRAYAARGMHIEAIRVTPSWHQATLWLALRLDDNPELIWVSGRGYQMLPAWSQRMTLGLSLMLLLVAAVSRFFVRRVTRPLARLQARMQHHARTGEVMQPVPGPDAVTPPPELQAMDEAYTQLAERLQRNERERALLLAGVSHDLRSPLARIRLAAEMLPETADNADGVAAVTRNVDRADQLIASFLEFVRAGTLTLNETVNAPAVVRQAVASFERDAQALQVDLPGCVLLHGANALLLERLVVNLVENALKHGGTPVTVHLQSDGQAMQLRVSDSGPGLPDGGAERLLEAFARGDASRGVPGFGLGLAIVQQIVTRMQGQLRFDHSPAHGHSVHVVLPLKR